MSTDELGLFIENDRTAFKPGEDLKLSILWALPKTPESLEVSLLFFTRGKGTEDVEVVSRHPITVTAPAGESSLCIKLPVAPYSFSGKLISLLWAVELVCEPGSRSARCEFVLSPTGKELALYG
jgi:hypothetical protein